MSITLSQKAPANVFMPTLGVTRGQTLLSAFIAILLIGSLFASATITLACAGLSACDSGAVVANERALPGYGVRS
ncbi:hypothetical protein [Terrarubrum flagellatum]|uniref:hypothetical protein n=1 Tax=Terrirubrum flagellatum TaxID=2895980 RepID=UPI0031452FB0